MSQFTKAFRLLHDLLGGCIGNPRLTAEALNLVPPAIRGMQFGRDVRFPNQAQAADGSATTANPLLTYFDAHTEGQGIWKWRHYFDIYHRHLARFVGRKVHVMEVGIYSGGSLPMWREYFGNGCRIYGVDIENACLAYEAEGTEVLIGDQADRSFWKKVRQQVPRIDVLIDDGGHEPEQQLVTLEEMLPHVSPGGVYLCEDIHSASNPFAAYVQGLARNLYSAVPGEVPAGTTGVAFSPTEFQRTIDSVHLYPFVAVIEKRAQPLTQLIAAKHGTQWQPFL